VRDKYSQSGIWSNWREVLTEGRGAQMVKLWENTNLSGAFAGQTLSLSTDYDFFLISYSYMGAGSSGFVERTETIRVKPGNASLIAGKTHLREIIIKSGQLQFSDAVNDSAATNNKQTIPTAIYGIKGAM
jgi:hypothetical protein